MHFLFFKSINQRKIYHTNVNFENSKKQKGRKLLKSTTQCRKQMIQTERLPSLLSSFDKNSLRSFNIFAPIKCPGTSNADYEDDELIEADFRSFIWHVCDLHLRRKLRWQLIQRVGSWWVSSTSACEDKWTNRCFLTINNILLVFVFFHRFVIIVRFASLFGTTAR